MINALLRFVSTTSTPHHALHKKPPMVLLIPAGMPGTGMAGEEYFLPTPSARESHSAVSERGAIWQQGDGWSCRGGTLGPLPRPRSAELGKIGDIHFAALPGPWLLPQYGICSEVMACDNSISVEGVALGLTHDSKVTPSHEARAGLPGLLNFGSIKREHNIAWPLAAGEVSVPASLFRALLRLALEHVQVDERYYLRTYPDVGEAVERGLFVSPRHHYVEFGYFEDRLPFRIQVDEEFYFRSNPDIKAGVEGGDIQSAQVHFERHGYSEGRLPRESWSLLAK